MYMTDGQVKYQLFDDWVFPEDTLESYADIVAYSKQFNGTMPGPSTSYFVNAYRRFKTEDPPEGIGTINIAPIRDGQLLGWGHLSWSGTENAWTSGELFVYLRPEFRRRGIGTQMCRTLLNQVSLDSFSNCYLEIPAFKQGGKEFVDHVLQAKLAKAQDRKMIEIRKIPAEEIERRLAKYAAKAAQQGIDIRFCRGKDLSNAVDLNQLIALTVSSSDSQVDLSAKTEQYLSEMKRWQNGGAQYWFYLAFDQAADKLVGFTRSGIKFEGSEGLAYDHHTKLAPGLQDSSLAQTLKVFMLNRLLNETQVTHWLNSAPSEAGFLVAADQALGFEYFTTHYTYHLSKSQAAVFLK
jgi:GNAT superfamily N-acetyltransferase